MKRIITTVLLIGVFCFCYGQKEIKAKHKIAFVLFEKQANNVILIPNYGKLYKFKIYRRVRSTDEFKLMAEKKKPPLPLKHNVGPYGVTWADTEYHTRDVEYMILAFDKKNTELCEMQIYWEEKK